MAGRPAAIFPLRVTSLWAFGVPPALKAATAAYDQRRFSPGKLRPAGDALWQATAGCLDVLTPQT